MSMRILATWVALMCWACAEDKASGSGSCSEDSDCERGTVCSESVCKAIACRTLNDCPGSGRTCVSGLQTCGPKECAHQVDGVVLECAAGSVCVDNGPNAGSCVSGSVRCESNDECTGLGADYTCCAGTCDRGCILVPDAGTLPVADAGVPVADVGPTTDGAPSPDEGVVPGEVRACSPCQVDGDCAALGAESVCTPVGNEGAFCTPACAVDMDCPNGFRCVPNLNVCLPAGFRCGCFATGCENGEVCDPSTAACVAPRGHCGACSTDADCAAGLTCGDLSGGKFCFAACGAGCPAGLECQDAQCKPPGGLCDACGGTCGAATPICNPGQNGQPGTCGECGQGSPCAGANERCSAEFRCVEGPVGGMCATDLDCAGDLQFCVNSTCVQCLQTSDCPARSACNQATFTCEDDPCGGVECQVGSMCDAATGRCAPGCQQDADCGDVQTFGCNEQTGQCYYMDGSCDLGGGDGVCIPGSVCDSNAFTVFTMKGSCRCQKEDPANPFSADLIPCQPGTACSQFALPGQPVPEFGACGIDIFGGLLMP